MAKPELGTKRICPETGRKFYDLNKDPIVSPYTGKSYPLSFFEDTKSEIIEQKAEKAEKEAVEDEDEPEADEPAVVSLEDAEEEETADAKKGENMPDLGDNTDDDIEIDDDDDDDDDTFLADDDDEDDDDVAGIIDVTAGDDDES